MDVEPSLSGDGRLVAFVSDRPGGRGGRDVYLYDREGKKLLPLPGLNSVAHEQSPSLSADGRYLAFVSERVGGAGERDVYLYDRQARKLLPTPGLNSRQEDFDPCVVVLAGP
jgi:Tol biopolymer transport system component